MVPWLPERIRVGDRCLVHLQPDEPRTFIHGPASRMWLWCGQRPTLRTIRCCARAVHFGTSETLRSRCPACQVVSPIVLGGDQPVDLTGPTARGSSPPWSSVRLPAATLWSTNVRRSAQDSGQLDTGLRAVDEYWTDHWTSRPPDHIVDRQGVQPKTRRTFGASRMRASWRRSGARVSAPVDRAQAVRTQADRALGARCANLTATTEGSNGATRSIP